MIYLSNEELRSPYFDDAAHMTGRTCRICGQPIRDFEAWAENGSDCYHMDCLDNLTTETFVKLWGGEVHD